MTKLPVAGSGAAYFCEYKTASFAQKSTSFKMRAVSRASPFYATTRDGELREVVLQLANSLRYDFYVVWRRCDASWRERVRMMCFIRLRRELIFILSHCGFRRLVRLHNQLFRHSRVAMSIVGEYITSIRMENISILSTVMDDYRRMCGKFINF